MVEYEVTERKTAKYIAIIRKPILTDEEREAREDEVKKSLAKFYKERCKNV